MSVFFTLTRRELASYFLSMTGYVILAAAALLTAVCLSLIILQVMGEPMPVPLNELFFGTWLFWLVVVPIVPLITMRAFALEKFSGTYETLMTAPVRDGQVVLAKFAAAIGFYAVMWIPLLGCLLTIHHFSVNPPPLDYRVLGATFFGLLLVGCVFVSFGCLASALTQSQAVAAIVALGFNLALVMAASKMDWFVGKLGRHGKLLESLAITDQMQDFARGIVDTRAVVSLVTIAAFFLFLTLRVIESRRWK